MADSFTYWMEYLFLSPDDEDWVGGFHQILERWQLEDCRRMLNAAKQRVDEKPHWVRQIQYCEGRYFLQIGEWDRAEACLKASLEQFDETEVSALFDIIGDLGLVHRLRGDMQAAIHDNKLCLKIALDNDWPDAAAESHIQLGLDYEITGELSRAEHHLLEAERLYQRLEHSLQLAVTRKSLALILLRQNRLDRAKSLFNETVPVLEEHAESLHVAQAYGNLGNIAVHEKDFNQARAYYAEALKQFRSLGAVLEICAILNNLGGIAYYEGSTDEAEMYFNESLMHARDLASVNDERAALMNLSLIYIRRRTLTEAAYVCRQAAQISRKLGDRRAYMDLLWRLWKLRLALVLERFSKRLRRE